MRRSQKRELAGLLVHYAGDLLDDLMASVEDGEAPVDMLDLTSDDVAAQLGTWLHHLPGRAWDNRLTEPT